MIKNWLRSLAPRLLIAMLFALMAMSAVGCRTTDTGTVNVVVNKGAIEAIKHPSDGFYSTMSFWRSSYEVDQRTFTFPVKEVKVFSKDNTPIILDEVQVTAHTSTDDSDVSAYVTKFGFDSEIRHKKRDAILEKQLETEARKAFNNFNAYDVYGNLGAIQTSLFSGIKEVLDKELFLNLESVQFGNWHFENPQIEAAASLVVANRKQKEAEDAAYQAALVKKQTQDLQALVFKDPNLFKIRQLELQIEIERMRADGIRNHQGPLTLIYGQQPATQLLLSDK